MERAKNAIFRMSFSTFDLSLNIFRYVSAICDSHTLLDIQY